jgi:hypothetical protein
MLIASWNSWAFFTILDLGLALTMPRPLGPGDVPRIVCPSGFRSLAPAFLSNAQPRLAPSFSDHRSHTYVLAALYLLEDVNLQRWRRQLDGEVAHTDAPF